MSCNNWPPLKREKNLTVLFPSSILSVESSILDKTYKVGIISRILAIFRVDDAIIYMDKDSTEKDTKLLEFLLNYQLTPPHLKKKIFKKTKILKYAGLLPPLRLPNHDPPKEAKINQILDGLIEECNDKECKVYLGKLGNGILNKNKAFKNKIVTVKIKKIDGDKILLSESSWGSIYTGFKVKKTKNIRDALNELRSKDYFIIGTSKFGKCYNSIKNEFEKTIKEKSKIAIAFGGPHTGLLSFTDEKDYDVIINSVINQGTLTVRTEEALISTLSILNLIAN